MAVYQIKFTDREDFVAYDSEAHVNLSLLDVIHDAGIQVRAGCRNGYCKACMVELVEGEVEYFGVDPRDLDEGECLLCSCVAKSDLVLKI